MKQKRQKIFNFFIKNRGYEIIIYVKIIASIRILKL